MKAVKGNREYSIEDAQQKSYQDAGFDIVEDGTVIAYGRGKTVPFEEYMLSVKEIGRLQKVCADLQEEKAELEKQLDCIKAEKKPASKKAGE